MADLLDIPALIEKAGIAVATIVGLIWILRWLSQAHLKALNDRIGVLEGVVTTRDKELAKARQEIVDRTDAHAQVMRELATQVTLELRETRKTVNQTNDVIRRLLDTVLSRPCAAIDLEPHPAVPVPAIYPTHRIPRPPSADDLPSQREIETDRLPPAATHA